MEFRLLAPLEVLRERGGGLGRGIITDALGENEAGNAPLEKTGESGGCEAECAIGPGSAGRTLVEFRLLAPLEVLRERGGGFGRGIINDALGDRAAGDALLGKARELSGTTFDGIDGPGTDLDIL